MIRKSASETYEQDTLVETWSKDEDPEMTYGVFVEERGGPTTRLRATVSSGARPIHDRKQSTGPRNPIR